MEGRAEVEVDALFIGAHIVSSKVVHTEVAACVAAEVTTVRSVPPRSIMRVRARRAARKLA